MVEHKGQGTVEIALGLTVICLLLFGLIDFGRIFHAYITLEHAGREAARTASVGASDQQIETAARNATASLVSSRLTVAVTPIFSERKRGTQVTVNITYSLPIVTPIMARIIPNPYILRTKTVMRVE